MVFEHAYFRISKIRFWVTAIFKNKGRDDVWWITLYKITRGYIYLYTIYCIVLANSCLEKLRPTTKRSQFNSETLPPSNIIIYYNIHSVYGILFLWWRPMVYNVAPVFCRLLFEYSIEFLCQTLSALYSSARQSWAYIIFTSSNPGPSGGR